ncbi:hypothetical protein B4135_0695 [Caldibacillus debilis]|uniref:Uncharacterized protein n=1 Tax=Caldibacillus debilis TaxID=301148 RepID=A0A150M5Y2_9BACI|nr:hypothetical protein B4135_0695 [Caldibacillus debilis]
MKTTASIGKTLLNYNRFKNLFFQLLLPMVSTHSVQSSLF